jgi:cation/acetate symporter
MSGLSHAISSRLVTATAFFGLFVSGADAATTALSPSFAKTGFFVLVVAGAVVITIVAARSTNSTNDFLAAGGRITPLQNGLAFAGDFMSAGAFLGLSALIFNSGFDGFIYAVGYIASWPMVMSSSLSRSETWGASPWLTR